MTVPRRRLGRTGLEVSALGFGGAPIGFADRPDDGAFVSLVGQAVALGITFFDTAPDYRGSEELIGMALRGRRSEVVLATKCGRLQTPCAGGWQVHEDWSEAGVLRTVEASLRRLDTDYLDLVQLHSPPFDVLREGTALRGLRRAQQAGLVRHLGISADGTVARYALTMDAFSTLQVSYSVLQQEPGDDLLPIAAARGVGVIVKQPLANGIPDMLERPADPDWGWKWDVSQRLDWSGAAAAADGGRSATDEGASSSDRLTLALRWLLTDGRIHTAIVGTTRLDHLEANVVAAQAAPLHEGVVQQFRDGYAAERAPGHAS